MARRPEKRAETAPAHTDIRVVDITVDNVGNNRLGMFLQRLRMLFQRQKMLFQAHVMSHPAQRMKIAAPVEVPSLMYI